MACDPRTPSQRRKEADMSIRLDHELLEPMLPGVSNDTLVFACSPGLRQLIDVEPRDAPVVELAWHGDESREDLVRLFATPSPGSGGVSAIWLADTEFEHFTPEELGQARIAAWSFFSAMPTSAAIRQAVDVTRQTDYQDQARIESIYLALLDDASHLVLTDRRHGLSAEVAHQDCEHWFSLNGPIGYGQQSVLPTGEMSVLADASGEFSSSLLPINGEILLYGEPLVHRGDPTVTREQAARFYEDLAPLGRHPAVASVEQGRITAVRPAPGSDPSGAAAAGRLFADDDRYRKIHELGFGTNAACRPLRMGNFFGDERHPGVHFGLGLGRHLSYHIDIVCPDTTVIAHTEKGEVDMLAQAGLI
jgi:hypothetical protein